MVAHGRAFRWALRHSHRAPESGRATGCRETLTLYPEPSGSGGRLRIVFDEGPGRFVPGGAPLGSGDVGFSRGASLNLHEPGAVRALLDAALNGGWQPDEATETVADGWALLQAATASGPGPTRPGPPRRG